MMGPLVIPATQDDWVFKFRVRDWDGYQKTLCVGVNGAANQEAAYRQACLHICPPRATFEGRARYRILGAECCRMHQILAKRPQPYPVLDTMKV